jgi:hypothetical protein
MSAARTLLRLQFFASLAALVALPECSKLVSAPGDLSDNSSIQVEKVNIRSFDQMNETMSLLTGVSVSKVASKYTEIGSGLRANLPGGNSLIEFNGSQQGSIVKLAALYCQNYATALSANNYSDLKSKYPFFGNFTNNMQTDWSDAQVTQLVESFYNNFWGACTNRPALSSVQSEIASLMGDMKSELKDDATLNKPMNYFQIACTVFLSSSCVSFF